MITKSSSTSHLPLSEVGAQLTASPCRYFETLRNFYAVHVTYPSLSLTSFPCLENIPGAQTP